MLKLLLHKNGQTGLVIFCDVCGNRIDDGDAEVMWLPDYPERPGATYTPRFACKKARCTRAVDTPVHHYSQPLGAALMWLLHNCGIDEKEARITAELLSSMS